MNYNDVENIILDNLVEFESKNKFLSSAHKSKINLVDCVIVLVMVEMRKKFMENKAVQISIYKYTLKDYLVWIKRFIESYLRDKKKNDNSDVVFVHSQSKNISITDYLLRYSLDNGLKAKNFSTKRSIDTMLKLIDSDFLSIYKYGFPIKPSKSKLTNAIKLLSNEFRKIYNLESNSLNNYFFNFEAWVFKYVYELCSVEHLVANGVSRINPKLVFCTNDSDILTRAFILNSKLLNAEVATVQHGLIQDWPLLKLMCTNTYFVWGKYYQELLNRYNFKVDVHCLGSFKHMKIIENFKLDRNVTDKSILFALSPPSSRPVTKDMYLDILNIVNKTVIKYGEKFKVIIKLHPGDNGELLREYFQSNNTLKERLTIIKDQEDVYSLILQSKVVIVVSSTVSIEAIILGKKVISLNFNFFDKLLPFSGIGNFYEVKTMVEFEELLSDILNNKDSELLDESANQFIDIKPSLELINNYILKHCKR